MHMHAKVNSILFVTVRLTPGSGCAKTLVYVISVKQEMFSSQFVGLFVY